MAQRASDQITVVDLTDGFTVSLEKYVHIFNGNTANALAGSTTCKIKAMSGADVVPCTVDVTKITTPPGISVTKDSNTTTPTLTITATTAFNTPGFLTIPIVVEGGIEFTQSIALSFAKTGATGASSTLMGLKNEAQMIVTNSAGVTTSATTVNVGFYGYVGASRYAVTAVVSGNHGDITVTTNEAGTTGADGNLILTFKNASSLGGTDSGIVTVTLTCNGVTRPFTFSWSKARAGVDGSDALTLEITSSQGLIFKNAQVATVLTASVYKGGALQNASQVAALGVIKWYKNGVYVSGKDGETFTVSAGDVDDSATFEARLDG